HEMLRYSTPYLQIAPIPTLQFAAGYLLSIWDAFDAIEANFKACMRLTRRCAEILRSVRDEACQAGPMVISELRQPLGRLELSFREVRDLLKEQAGLTFLDRYLRRGEILKDIANCDLRLNDALNAFSLSIQIRLLRLVQAHEGEQRRPAPSASSRMLPSSENAADIGSTLGRIRRQQNVRDGAQDLGHLRRTLWTTLEKNSDAAMLDVLQVRQEDIPEAIVALQHALDREVYQLRSESVNQPAARSYRRGSATASVSLDPHRSSAAPRLATRAISDAPDTLDRDFLASGLESLQRLSGGNLVSLPQWAITHYEIGWRERVGIGSFSDVYHASWFGQEVAVKVLSDVTPRALFVREVEIWKTLRHPNVLELLGASSTTSAPFWFLVSPYHRNGNLVQYLKGLDADADIDALRPMHEIAEGMAYLHRRGVFHGDLKASNVLVDDELHCVVADFGLSEMRSEVNRSSQDAIPLSRHGTLQWLAPELMVGESGLTAATDVYAFAITCLEILSKGNLPWNLMDDHTIRQFVLKEDRRPSFPLSFVPHHPLRRLVEAAWDFSPQRRPSFASIASDLGILRERSNVAESTELQVMQRRAFLALLGLPDPHCRAQTCTSRGSM
ncbi:kinase-like domain-containing protein, partial [Vararia minispora EC-137]